MSINKINVAFPEHAKNLLHDLRLRACAYVLIAGIASGCGSSSTSTTPAAEVPNTSTNTSTNPTTPTTSTPTTTDPTSNTSTTPVNNSTTPNPTTTGVGAGKWSTPVALEQEPALAMVLPPFGPTGTSNFLSSNPNGSITATWNTSATSPLRTSTVTTGKTWGPASNVSASIFKLLQIAGSDTGLPTVYGTAGGLNVQEGRAKADGSWSAYETIATYNNSKANFAEMVASRERQGNRVIAWSDYDSTAFKSGRVFMRRFTAASGWGAIERLPLPDGTIKAHNYIIQHIALDSNGVATIVWAELGLRNSADTMSLWSINHSPDKGFSAVTDLQPDPTFSAVWSDMAIDTDNNVTLLWTQFKSGVGQTYARRFSSASGWSNSTRLDEGAQAGSVKLLALPGGQSVAFWAHRLPDAGARVHVRSSQFSAPAGWSTAVNVSDPGVEIIDFSAAANNQGKALVAWNRITPRVSSTVEARIFNAASGLGDVELVSTTSTSEYAVPYAALGPLGIPQIVLIQSVGGSLRISQTARVD
jgi:hypothetical protein